MAVITVGATVDVASSRRQSLGLRIDVGDASQSAVQASVSQAAVDAVGVFVNSDAEVDPVLGMDLAALQRCGFDAGVGQTLLMPRASGPVIVAVGAGPTDQLDLASVRNAAAAFTTAVPGLGDLAVTVPTGVPDGDAAAAQAVVEGGALARYQFDLRSHKNGRTPLQALTLLTHEGARAEVERGMDRGGVFAAAAALSRDLATCPPRMLSAERMAEAAEEIGRSSGLTVEIFDRAALQDLGCGGLLGVNLGSVEEPRMIKLSYPGTAGGGRLTLVGKGIMYDSGGISLKPSDAVHATMKNDMTGAGTILAAMSALAVLDCPSAVTGYLMCTDNMPSGSSLKLGDVITMRGGTTVEVLNTDAEGRLVMADALALAAEESPDAIVDIATLTGATMRALGVEIAGVMGTDAALVDQIKAAGAVTDEPVWEFPLERRYRAELNSTIADLTNMGGPNAGGITAGLFLAEFVGNVPWAHIDIAGTAQMDGPSTWRTKGPTGFGARLLIELALNFRSPGPSSDHEA